MKRKNSLAQLMLLALGFLCALILCAIFYGTMVYQLAGETGDHAAHGQPLREMPPLMPGTSASDLFPGSLLALDSGTLESETAQDVSVGGQVCRVITRTYRLDRGTTAQAVSAAPAAYLERLSQEGWEPQLITGFMLAGMDAAYESRGEEGVLAARDGDFVYLLIAQESEQAMYALGAGARLEK